MSFEREPIIPEGSSLDLAFQEVGQAETALVEARHALQAATDALAAARQKASEEMKGYFVGKHVKVTGSMEEETAYNVNEGGWMTEKAWGSVTDQAAVITGAGMHSAHHSSDVSPRLTMEMKGGPRNGRSIKFRLNQIRGLVELEEAEKA